MQADRTGIQVALSIPQPSCSANKKENAPKGAGVAAGGERVRQIEAKALQKLARLLKRHDVKSVSDILPDDPPQQSDRFDRR